MIGWEEFDKPNITLRKGIANKLPVTWIHIQVSENMTYYVLDWAKAKAITEIWIRKDIDRFQKYRYTDSLP